MRILQVCPKPPYPPRDGGSLAMYNLARSLQRAGHTITVLTIQTVKHPLPPWRYKELSAEFETHVAHADSTFSRAALLKNLFFSTQPYQAVRLRSDAFIQKLTGLLKTSSFDIIQLEGVYLMQYLPVIKQHSKALVALRAHNIEHGIWQRITKNLKNPLKKWYFGILTKRIRRFETNCINRYDLLVPITGVDLEEFRKLGNTRPAWVCRAGIDPFPPTFSDNTKDESDVMTRKHDFSMFFLGSLDWIPNQEGIIWFINRVFPAFHKRNPLLELHVAGRNAPAGLIRKMKVPGVIFHGEVEDSHEFMKAFRVMVVPCFSGSGMRVKIIEAMAMGKPVVTTPVGAEGLDAEHGKNLLIAKNATDFLDHLERLMKYPDLCHQLGENARQWVGKEFNNTELARALSQFYLSQLK